MQTVIWDWNGTLLNDTGLCISIINRLLKKRNLDLINYDLYREVFSFPVINYYKSIGFDFEKEHYSIPAKEFIGSYNTEVVNCRLHRGAKEILSYFEEKNIRQFVLSAMEQNMLERTLKQNSVFSYFEAVFGLDNHYAASKVERGKQLIEQFGLNRNETVIIGDTTHDSEVAGELGIKCILIPEGHQSVKRLEATGAIVVNGLSELKNVALFNILNK